MTSPRFTTAELRDHSSSISKSSRAARVAAAAARGAGKGMTSAERSAAAKKGWETRRRKGYKPKSKVGTRQLHGRPVTDKSVVRTSGRKPGGVTQEKAVKQLGPKNGSTAIRRAAVKRAVDAGKGRASTRSERAKALQTAASRDGRVTAARHGNQRRKKWADQDAESQVRVALKFNGDDPGRAIDDLRYQIRSIEDAKKQMKAERRDARGSSDYADMPAQRRYDERLKNLRAALKILRTQHQSVKPKAKGKESMADRAARGGPSVGDQMAAQPMDRSKAAAEIQRRAKEGKVKPTARDSHTKKVMATPVPGRTTKRPDLPEWATGIMTKAQAEEAAILREKIVEEVKTKKKILTPAERKKHKKYRNMVDESWGVTGSGLRGA